ncbi:uncharacterized protein [Primulina eburnea]|uniref:uncharacterized protein n=1 Tax=Primulina eburnea TaxID=1245227 RepID=UPI003C6C3B18
MKVVSWNIGGSGSATRRGLIRAVLAKEKPELIVLQEIKREVVDRRFIASLWKSRFVEWVTLPAVGRSGGILVMWDPMVISVKDNMIGEFSVSIQIQKDAHYDWWFTAVYGPCQPRLRTNFWDELAGLSVICEDRWCLGGDFNVVRSLREKINSRSQTSSMFCFDSLIQELELCDPPLLNGKFTWSSLRSSPICCRLDRFMFTVGWTEIYPCYRKSILPRITSDHFPLVLDLAKNKWGPTPFRFENVWLRDTSFKNLTKLWWNNTNSQGWAGYRFMMKIKTIKGDIKRWNEEVYGRMEMKSAELSNKISRFDKLEGEGRGSEEISKDRKEPKLMLEELIRRKNQIHYQKCKVKWIKEGDQNTKFFHSLLNQRKSKSTIDSLKRNDGSITTCGNEIVSIESINFSTSNYISNPKGNYFSETSPRERKF